MALTTGTRIGPCEIHSTLGVGGMGEVYRARDTKLGRDVALKVLQPAFAGDPERLARFEREAQVLASLNHPHIAAIYGLEEADAIKALVLEFVDGPTLADRLAQGPLSLSDALEIARQIADALEAAHEQGIIHRDLKPANIKVRLDGAVKVLDFGLAKLAGPLETLPYSNVTQSPTLTMQATFAGTILGTAAYMSPEQAKGKAVDRRADIWAFGVVLWEMLTGRRMYDGETAPETLARVIEREPDLAVLPASTPESIRTLLRRCLTKDPRARLQAIGEARIVVEGAKAEPVGASASEGRPSPQNAGAFIWRRVLPVTLVGALVVALAVWLMKSPPSRATSTLLPVRMHAELGAEVSLDMEGTSANLAMSPEGNLLAFVAQAGDGESQLYVRHLNQLQAMPLNGTAEARHPFFSPDGGWIGFFADGKLKKIAVTGGSPVTICDAPSGRGGAWAEDGTIAFTPAGGAGVGLWKVADAGGKPEPLIMLADRESLQRWPQFLDQGRVVLFTSGGVGDFQDASVVVQRLSDGRRTVVQRGGFFGRYVASGHIVFIRDGTLWAVPFDLNRLEATGQPVPVIEGVAANAGTGMGMFAVSTNGTAVYLAGRSRGRDPISWLEADGKESPLRTTPGNWNNPQFSSDGARLVFDLVSGGSADVWVYDWARDAMTRVTTDEGVDIKPVWTADGQRIAYASSQSEGAVTNLYWRRADGTGEQRLTESGNTQTPASFHPSGKFLAFSEVTSKSSDVMILPIEGDEASGWRSGTPTVFVNGPSNELEPMFSPDGRWIAYSSNESGQYQVYVQPFPARDRKWLISTGSGVYPTWSRAKSELLYLNVATRQIMAVSFVVNGDEFVPGKSRLWSPRRILLRQRLRSYDLHPDGRRIAASVDDDTSSEKQDKVVFVFDFFDELRRRAASR